MKVSSPCSCSLEVESLSADLAHGISESWTIARAREIASSLQSWDLRSRSWFASNIAVAWGPHNAAATTALPKESWQMGTISFLSSWLQHSSYTSPQRSTLGNL